MNYRHIYHAGNHADVFKHAILTLIAGHLRKKEKPFFILDTHAGIGLYDLSAPEAMKTGEAADGIGEVLRTGKLRSAPAYLDIVRAVNKSGPLRFYPGSPAVLQALLRPADRLVLCELHREDAETLRGAFRGDRRVGIHYRDGYEALLAFVPPPERRGLVLIDPPYEATDEAARLGAALVAAHRKWLTGIYAAWFPIKNREAVRPLFATLAAGGIENGIVAEFLRHPEDGVRLAGSGMVILNPPWRMDEAIAALASELAAILGAPVQQRPVRPLQVPAGVARNPEP